MLGTVETFFATLKRLQVLIFSIDLHINVEILLSLFWSHARDFLVCLLQFTRAMNYESSASLRACV